MTQAAIAHPRREKRASAPPTNLGGMFDEIAASVNKDAGEGVRLAIILNAVGRRAYGPLLLVIGLFAISPITVIPGMSWFAAFVTLLIAGQMAIGLKRPWLPKGLLETRIPRDALHKGLEKGRPWADRIDKLLKPRLTFLTAPPFVNVIALVVVAAALITIPLAMIPLAPLLPSAAIVLFGLGMTARDGLWLSIGLALCAGAIWLVAPLIF
ncbi:MAG: exopolysaccharide biosynthesis protein [Terricaulis sp.]